MAAGNPQGEKREMWAHVMAAASAGGKAWVGRVEGRAPAVFSAATPWLLSSALSVFEGHRHIVPDIQVAGGFCTVCLLAGGHSSQ